MRRHRFCLALTVAVGALLAIPAGAQTFQYSEIGTGARAGTLTLSVVGTRPSTELLQVTLDIGSLYQGLGVRHLFDHGDYALDFVLAGLPGEVFFYEGTGTAGVGNQASGTFFRLGSPQAIATWQIKTDSTPPVINSDETSKALDLINQEREANGLTSLTRVSELDASAMEHARDLATNSGSPSTIGSDGSTIPQRMQRNGYRLRTWGEVIAVGRATAADAVAQWLNGTGRQIVLNPNFRDCGIALVDQAGSRYRYYWVVDFGAR